MSMHEEFMDILPDLHEGNCKDMLEKEITRWHEWQGNRYEEFPTTI
jgi:hypothetical protein